MKQISKGRELGKQLVEQLKNGDFPKNHLSNHGKNFTGGREELLVYEMNRYMSSCGHAMMENRLAQKGCTYLGF